MNGKNKIKELDIKIQAMLNEIEDCIVNTKDCMSMIEANILFKKSELKFSKDGTSYNRECKRNLSILEERKQDLIDCEDSLDDKRDFYIELRRLLHSDNNDDVVSMLSRL